MTWVKICGITNLDDALMAVEAGADALGFVFYEKSPRRVEPEAVREIVKRLPDGVEKVGVFAGELVDGWPLMADNCGLDAGQIAIFSLQSGTRKAVHSTALRRPIKAYAAVPAVFCLESQMDPTFSSSLAGCFERVFLDSGTPQQPGGTGKTFEWSKVAPSVDNLRKHVKVVIAGGLNSNNVSEAMRVLHPWGVDVSSGVESSPGKKDPDKVRAFIAAVRNSDKPL